MYTQKCCDVMAGGFKCTLDVFQEIKFSTLVESLHAGIEGLLATVTKETKERLATMVVMR